MRVLVAEDHERLARAVAKGLRRYGMVVDVALDGDDALARLAANRYDVVVLDRDLPGTHGDDICRVLVAEGCESRVLMLTAASSVKARVEGLGLGADDYLPKPFDFTEMVARVQALGRRPGAPQPPGLVYRDVTLDPQKRTASRAGRPLASAPRSSPSSNACWQPGRSRSLPRSCSNGYGTRPPTRSPPPSKPPSTGCGPSWATRRSSRPSARPATESEGHEPHPSPQARLAVVAALTPAHRPAASHPPRRCTLLALGCDPGCCHLSAVRPNRQRAEHARLTVGPQPVRFGQLAEFAEFGQHHASTPVHRSVGRDGPARLGHAPPSRRLRDRARPSSPCSPCCSAGSSPAGCCARSGPSPPPPGGSRPAT